MQMQFGWLRFIAPLKSLFKEIMDVQKDECAFEFDSSSLPPHSAAKSFSVLTLNLSLRFVTSQLQGVVVKYATYTSLICASSAHKLRMDFCKS